MATRNEQAAVEQKEQAEIAREEAYQRRLLSIAKSISVKLLQINDDPDLQALLAYQAYKFNTKNNGSPYDADIYGGLYRAIKSNISSSYNVYSGHNESAVKAMAWLKSRKGFLSADSKGRILFMSGDYSNNRSYSEIARAGQAIEALVISPDESVFACGTSGRGIFVYRLADPDNFYRLEAHNGNVNMLAFNSSGSRLISAGMDNTIMVWDLSARTGQQFAVLSARPSSLAVSNFSNQVVVGSRDGKLYEYDLDNPGEGRLIYNNSGNPVMAVTYSPDDRAVVIGTLNGTVRIINRSGNSSGITLRGPEARVTDLAFSYNGKFMAASSNDGNVYLWQTSDWQNEPVIVTDNGGFVLTLCFSDDSRYFYSGSTEFPRLIGRPVEASLMVDDFCRLVDRNLSQAEWDLYIAEDIPYEMTCPR
jgi:WD40 repeat protein